MEKKTQKTTKKDKRFLSNVKELLNKYKVQVITTTLAILAIMSIAIVAILQGSSTKNTQGGISPELAKAMTYPQVNEGENAVDGTDNVKFDAFFLRDLNGDGEAEGIRGTSREVGKEDTLYMELNVQTAGYLEDAKITVNGANFYLQTALPEDEQLMQSYIGNNTKEIAFKTINNGTQKLLTGIVRSGDYSVSSRKLDAIGNNVNNYSKTNSVTLTGTYVDENNQRTPITKTVDFDIDWYGTTTARIYTTSQNKNIEEAINEEEGAINLDFTVYTEETEKELLLSKNHVEGEIPELNGYAPAEVIYTGSNGVFEYNAETRTFTITRQAQVEEDGTITSKLSTSNSYGIRVTYPIEAYYSLGTEIVEIKIPVKTYYEGYNNTSSEFTNPYKSNIAQSTIMANYSKPVGEVAEFEVLVGKYITSPTRRYVISKEKPLKIYNGESEEAVKDEYTVSWRVSTGSTKSGNIVMKETATGTEQKTDTFIKTNSQTESMEDVTSYTGIYFSNPESMLGEEGEIKVYDDQTGILLATFNKDNWNDYTTNNPYKYETAVKHIRIETSSASVNTSMYVYNVKTLDDEAITTKYTKEQFDELQYIQSNLAGYIDNSLINTDLHQANYEAPTSIADIDLSKNTISTQITEENFKITISAYANELYNQVKWQNGTFLVKLPEEIIYAEINNVAINNENVSLESYELIEQNNQRFIKIVTKNNTPQTFTITIDTNISADPRMSTATRNVELYASNENTSEYYYSAKDEYDINNNLNVDELVNHKAASISMVSPNSLLTNQVGSNYDDKGSIVISPQIADVKPTYAVVDQEKEKTAQIGVQIHNNYTNTISDIVILGKIPFEGNTYVLSGKDLGSTFTTKMTSAGIEMPEELKQYGTIYYSENKNPTKDLNESSNGWKTAEEVTNWDNVKTFLIDLGSYVMPTGKDFVFNYTILIPNGLEFNQIAFSHHGVYFSLDTDQGKYRTQTEPNKIGFRIAEKYNLELTKTQTGKDKSVAGATYSIKEQGQEEGKTGVTNSSGKLTITNLYAEKIYEIQEIKTPSDYELNSDVIRFIAHVDEEGNISIEKLAGTTKGNISIVKNEGEDYKVTVNVEDEVKASLKVVKKEQGTNATIQGARFKLTGYNISEIGRTLTTNKNGEITFSGLSVNQEYTLQEIKADGYYLADPIKFKIVNNGGNYTVEKIEDEAFVGEFASQSTTEEDGIPVISVEIENEKIPTYDLQIIKVKKTTESTLSEDELIAKAETSLANTEVEYLAGAKFKLYKGTEEVGEYTTDESGKVTISGLYQYESEKNIDQTYTLKEVFAPIGYAKVKDITFKAEEVDGTLVLKEMDENDEESNSTRYTSDENTVKLTIEDSPSLKLIKKDAETQSTIPNVKFAIYNIDDETEQPATNSKGEFIGTKETINGREYYTVVTDENGEITADLTEGLYKVEEVEAPEQYDIEGQTYYFGIGASREAPEHMIVTQATSVSGNDNEYIYSVASTSDGGYIAGGFFSGRIQLGEDILLNSNGGYDGMIIKYNAEGDVQWARNIGGRDDDYIYSVASTSDEGVIVGGYFKSNSIQVGDYTLTNNGSYDGILIRYDVFGVVEWARNIGGSSEDRIYSVAETSNGEIIVGGYFSNSIQIGEDITLINKGNCDGMLIKYDALGEVKWARSVGGNSADEILSVVESSDGGIIVGGYFSSSSIQLGENITLMNNGDDDDGMLIKYDTLGEVKWARSIGGSSDDRISSVASTSDGGIIAGGYFSGSSIQIGEDIILTNNSDIKWYYDGMIIKYNASGEVKWARSAGGDREDYITSVVETSDGSYVAGGYFYSSSIQVGENITLTNNGDAINCSDAVIIEYDTEGAVKWTRSIGGSSSESFRSVTSTSDGEIIAGGSFYSDEIQVGDYTLKNNDRDDGMIIKYEKMQLANPIVTKAEGIGGSDSEQIVSVVSTSNGGIIAGGYFSGSSIQIGEDVTLINNGNCDGMLIKYDEFGEVEWVKSIGGSSVDKIQSVATTSDGGIIVGGYFSSSSIQLKENITLTNNGDYDGMLIKYDEFGEVEWAKSIGGSSTDQIQSVVTTSDGGIIVGGYFSSSSIQLKENITLTNNGDYDGMLIKYDEFGEVEWARSVGGSSDDRINSVAATSDGEIIVGGYFISSSIQLRGNITLTSNGNSDGLIVKYNAEGEVEWARSVGGSSEDRINSVAETSNGGIIAGGYIAGGYSSLNGVQIAEDIILESNGNADGLIVKYNAEGIVEWARSVGGSNDDMINSVAETNDGGVIVGGNFLSFSIQVGKYILTKDDGTTNEGMLMKYNAKGVVEWAKTVGGKSSDYIYSVASTNNARVIAGGYFESSTIEVDGKTLTNQGSSDGIILEVVNQVGVPEVQELIVENSRKEFKITTDVNEIDGIKGGSISGEDKLPYETVKYGETSINKIKMTPDSGYEIIGITVNGAEYSFTEDADGTYTMPAFTNVTEDKHIVVTFALKDNKLTINKVDSKTNEQLLGATFKIDQIEERTEPENVIGELTANGQEYNEADTTSEVTGVLGNLTNNGTYYFIQNDDGTLTPTNSKTYQTATGGTAGIQSSTANSYIPIDLRGKEGNYVVVVNASVSSESRYDYGYATVNQSTTAPEGNTTTGRFMYNSGIVNSANYMSTVLVGGQIYYLHLGYKKDSSGDRNDDQIVINSVKVYESKSTTYNFEENGEGGYESNNQGKDSTVANSYIPIDLRNNTGKYNLTVNANVSSESSYDYGYATVTETTNAPSYSSSTGRFIYISGISSSATTPTDYTTVLQGGKMYYLHLGYYKNASTSSGDDKFTVNSIEVTLNDSELYHTEVTTDSKGQGIVQLPFGKYQITETKAPEGYELNTEPTVIEFRADGNNHEITIKNNKQAKVIVHHYLKNDKGEYTTEKVAEDETIIRTDSDTYTTSPKLDLQKYELEKDSEGNYVIPEKATGNFVTGETIEVKYYYEEKEIPLTVHHYIEGTTQNVPLKTGTAQDEQKSGKENEEYTTESISNEQLSDKYELVEIPQNANGYYTGDEVIVTYYYKLVTRPLTIIKTGEENQQLEGIKFTIKNAETQNVKEYQTDEEGKIQVTLEAGTYEITETETKDDYQLPQNPTKTITITKNQDTYELNLSNEKKEGTVITHYYIQGTKNKVPSKVEGQVVEDITQTGKVGEIWATKEAENVNDKYELVSVEGETSGEYKEGLQEVIYYYKLSKGTVLVHHYKENTTESLSPDETIVGDLDATYTTSPADDIPANYELVEMPKNYTGTIKENQTVVTYYYRLKTPDIITPTITKETSIAKLTDKNQVIDYTINYTAKIDKYIGEATITIVDELPYEIDEQKSNIAGGIYDSTEKTITWTQEIAEIDTFVNGAKEINITKEITLVYKDIDVTQANVTNKATGTVKLETPEKEDTKEDTKEIPTEYLVSVPVKKLWIDNEIQEARRPEKITLILKNGETEVKRQEITKAQETTDRDTWEYTFEDLPKYDALGNEINYTVDEEKTNDFYAQKEITGDMETGYVISNTFTRPTDAINVTVTKVWEDNNNEAKKRPGSIKIQLKNGNNVERTQEINGTENAVAGNSNRWEYTFTGLDKYNENGQEIVYSADETEVNSGELQFYENTGITGDFKTGLTITNTFTQNTDTIDLKVTKKWVDNDVQAQRRPTSVIIQVKNENEVVRSQEINGTDNGVEGDSSTWEYTFTDLPKYDRLNNIINYTVEEVEKTPGDLHFYTKNIEGTTITNTFTKPIDPVSIVVDKEWIDNSAQAQRRPGSIRIVVKSGAETVRTQEINVEDTVEGQDNVWRAVFTGLDKYDENGQEIQYTVDEEEVTPGDLYFYETAEATGNMETGYVITNTFTRPEDTIDITVNKVWEDNSNVNGKRPDSIRIVVTGDGKTYNQTIEKQEGNTWTTVFADLPKYDNNGKEIEYKVEERETEEGDLYFYNTAEATGSVETGYTITNTFEVPDVRISVSVRKLWIDNETQEQRRPDSITLVLKNGDIEVTRYPMTEEQDGTENNDAWEYTFANLPKYDEAGREIKYTVEEEGTNEFYAQNEITGDMKSGYVIGNTFTKPTDKVSVTVNKVWVDNEAQAQRRPETIRINVLGENSQVVASYDLNTTTETSHTFTELDKYNANGQEITYTVEEEETNEFYAQKDITGDMSSEFTITNTFTKPDDTIDLTVNKAWEDNGNVNGKRPESIELIVAGNGQEYKQTVEKQENNTWTTVFENLPKYNDNGEEIEYTLTEKAVEENDLYFYENAGVTGDVTTGLTITNKFKVPDEKVSVKVTKRWEDTAEQQDRRPSEVTVVLKGNDTTETYNLKEGENWEHTFTNLPKYDETGNEINYTVDEVTTNEFYTKKDITGDMYAGYVITNTFTTPEETVKVEGTKVWEDNNNEAQKRPTSITMQIKNGNQVVDTAVIDAEENWKHEFTVPKYNDSGYEIKYTVDEVDLGNKFYTKDPVEGNMTDGFVITNRFNVPDEKVEITVNKVWVDNETQAQRRPEIITIKVLGENSQEVASYDLNTTTETSHTFTNLPKYNSLGDEIKYTVDEVEKVADDLYFYEKNVGEVTNKNGEENKKEATITNTFKKPTDTRSLTINKVWNDNEVQAQRRPESIRIVIKNGEEIVAVQEINAEDNKVPEKENQWAVTFTGLDKYNENGQEIKYSVDEEEVNAKDLYFYTKELTDIEDGQATIRNTFKMPGDTVNLVVNKVWNDESNVNEKRPDSIKLVVTGNGKTYIKILNKQDGDTWQTVFENLPKYDEDGQEIEYQVEEVETEEGDLFFYEKEETIGNIETGYTLTNRFNVPDEKISITINKVWVDSEIQETRRPEGVVLVLNKKVEIEGKETVQEVSRQEITSSNALSGNKDMWQYTFADLPKYDDKGNIIEYTVEEKQKEQGDLYFYETTIGEMVNEVIEGKPTGNKHVTITNTFTRPEDTKDVTVTKVWEDNNDEAKKRPESINIQLKNGNQVVRSQEINAIENSVIEDSNRWEYNFTGLEKYDVNGQEIIYSADESEVNSSDLQFYTKHIEGTQITNTFTQNIDKVDIEVTKKWVDNEKQARKKTRKHNNTSKKWNASSKKPRNNKRKC